MTFPDERKPAKSPPSVKTLATPLVAEPPGDGFPAEEDVSAPPEGSDQAKDRKDRKME